MHYVGGGGERGSFFLSPSLFIVHGGEVDKWGGTTFFSLSLMGRGKGLPTGGYAGRRTGERRGGGHQFIFAKSFRGVRTQAGGVVGDSFFFR